MLLPSGKAGVHEAIREEMRGAGREEGSAGAGLSAETMAAVEAGEAAIVDDDPQAEILEELGETAQWRTQHE